VDIDRTFGYFASNQDRFYNMTDVSAAGGNEYQFFKFNKFLTNERITAGYLSATNDIGKLRTIAGVRYELTNQEGRWQGAANTASQPDANKRYGNLFPGCILTYSLTKNQKLRLAYTTSITRPNLTDILVRNSVAASNPNADPEMLTNPGTYNIGNPNLKPQKSQSFDFSYEYYYQPTGLFSVQLFKKDIKDFIYTFQKSELREYLYANDPVSGEPIYRQGTFTTQQPVNGASQEIYGVEASIQQNLRKVAVLPKALRGLGIQSTITCLKGKSTVFEQVGTNGPLVPVKTNYLISQPSQMYNVQLYWDYNRFTARIAYNHRGNFRRVAGNRDNLLLGVKINDDIDQWSFKVTYRLSREWGLFLSGRNLTNGLSKATYQDRRDLPLEYAFSGRSLSAGVRWDY
jgi:TonB-dependent receptor